MSVSDAAVCCRVSTQTFRRWTQKYPKLATNFSGRNFVAVADVEAIARGRKARLWTFSQAADYFSRKMRPHVRERLLSPNFAEVRHPAALLVCRIYDEMTDAFPAIVDEPWLPLIPKAWVDSMVEKYIPIAEELPR